MNEILIEQDRLRRERDVNLRQRIKRNQKAKERRERLKAEGRCTRCGSVHTVGKQTLCPSCSEDQRKATQRLREKKRASGECMFCASPAIPGKVLCERCAGKNHTKYMERRGVAEVKNIE